MGIRKKVLMNYFIIILLVVLVFEALFITSVNLYYSSTMNQFLMNKARFSRGLYSKSTGVRTQQEDIDFILKNVLTEDERIQVQILDMQKNLLYDSLGIPSGKEAAYKDYLGVLEQQEAPQIYKGKNDATGEKIMAVSTILKSGDRQNFVLRYIISVEKVSALIWKINLAAISVGFLVIGFTLVLSLILAKSLVDPIFELKNSAQVMAKGDYKIRAQKYENDEIGELADTFNDMARQIERTSKLKSDFISSISHELRTPLTSVKGWAETLFYGNYKDEDSLNRGLEIIIDEINRFILLVNELLDFSRLESGRIKVNFSSLDFSKLSRRVINQFKYRLKNEGVHLNYEIPSYEIKIAGDKDRLKQTLINVIDNAIKYMDDSNDKKRIDIFVGATDMAEIRVCDNGIGMKEEDVEKAFDKFYRADYKKSGSGLGLSICNEIIKLHGGEISISSLPGQGTAVTIRLPLEGDADE